MKNFYAIVSVTTMGVIVGNVVGFPLRGMVGDLDKKMEIAALMVGVHTLIAMTDALALGATAEITLNGERRWIAKAEGVELARDMLRQREACLAGIGCRAARQLLAEVEQTLGAVRHAEGVIRNFAG